MSSAQTLKEIIPYDDFNWEDNMNAYQRNKKSLKWGSNSMPRFVTHKMMKEKDREYNPILQKYANEAEDNALRLAEQSNLRRSLSQYYDNSLRYEQTFNLINLSDRLKGFEDHPNYPKTLKKKLRENKETTKMDYNILSNISLSQHSSLPPEMRKHKERDASVLSGKPRVINAFRHRDYDIISNRYKDLHDEKSLVDHQISELTASKHLQERKGYDFINCRAYNKDIQQQYDLKANRSRKVNSLTPLYNPVNNSVLDEKRLARLDEIEQKKKLRYKVKQSTEDYYKAKSQEDYLKREEQIKNHQSYSRYRAFDQRGYEAINHQRNFGYYRKNFQLQNDKSDWEVILDNTSDKETFSTKPIYKPLYDKSDLDNNLDQFYLERKALLGALPKLEEEQSFKRCKQISKLDHERLNEEMRSKLTNPIGNRVDINKKEWFSTKKVVGVSLQ